MHPRSLLSPQQREEAVALFELGYGAMAAAAQVRVPQKRVEGLYNRWRIHGRLCLMSKPTKTRHTYEVKRLIVERFLAGESKPELAQEFQLSSPKLIEAWVRRYRAEGEEGLRPKPKGRPRKDGVEPARQISELERVQRENERLRAENAYLKKLRDLRDQGHR